MKFYFIFILTLVTSLFPLTSLGQKVKNVNKKTETIGKSSSIKDTTIIKVIIESKDTLYFGSNKKMLINEGGVTILNVLKTNNNLLNFRCSVQGVLLVDLNLEVLKNQLDTVPVVSVYDPTTIIFRKITNSFTCNIKSMWLNNFTKIQTYEYCRQFLNRLLKFKD